MGRNGHHAKALDWGPCKQYGSLRDGQFGSRFKNAKNMLKTTLLAH